LGDILHTKKSTFENLEKSALFAQVRVEITSSYCSPQRFHEEKRKKKGKFFKNIESHRPRWLLQRRYP